MVSLNLTLAVEMVLFLIFSVVARRLVFVPLHRMLLDRHAKVHQDEEQAQKDREEADRIQQLQADRLAEAQRLGTQRLREARFNAYRQNRDEADEQRKKLDADVAAFNARIHAQVDQERKQYPRILPGLVETMDRQINAEGSLM